MTVAAAAVPPILASVIQRQIYTIRGHSVMMDADLADLYHVQTSNLNKAVKRNLKRFPQDFMFKLTAEEWEGLRFQNGMSKSKEDDERRGGRRYMPYVFTEQGVAMLSSVLSSEWAVEVNIVIMRVFVDLRKFLSTNLELAHKVEELYRAQREHGAHIDAIWEAIHQMVEAHAEPKRRIGFQLPSAS